MIKKDLLLFDLDGTIAPARQPATNDVRDVLKRLRQAAAVGIVSGSDMSKICDQLVRHEKNLLFEYADYIFAENGTVARFQGQPLGEDVTLQEFLGDDRLNKLISFVLHYIADLDIPVKRGTFVELRSGLLNISPIGRNCSAEERQVFYRYDKIRQVRKRFVEVLEKEFSHMGLQFAIGGQISIDCYPDGWDKRYCLRHLEGFEKIHFFGDKTELGGNDHLLFKDGRVIGHSVTCPEDTLQQLKDLKYIDS